MAVMYTFTEDELLRAAEQLQEVERDFFSDSLAASLITDVLRKNSSIARHPVFTSEAKTTYKKYS